MVEVLVLTVDARMPEPWATDQSLVAEMRVRERGGDEPRETTLFMYYADAEPYYDAARNGEPISVPGWLFKRP
jgi:hypothetical protein